MAGKAPKGVNNVAPMGKSTGRPAPMPGLGNSPVSNGPTPKALGPSAPREKTHFGTPRGIRRDGTDNPANNKLLPLIKPQNAAKARIASLSGDGNWL